MEKSSDLFTLGEIEVSDREKDGDISSAIKEISYQIYKGGTKDSDPNDAGCLFGIVIGLISKAGSSFFGNLGLFSFSFCEPTQLMSESWIYGTLVSFIAGLFLFAVLPIR